MLRAGGFCAASIDRRWTVATIAADRASASPSIDQFAPLLCRQPHLLGEILDLIVFIGRNPISVPKVSLCRLPLPLLLSERTAVGNECSH